MGRRLTALATQRRHDVYAVYNSHPVTQGKPERVDLTDETAVKEYIVGKGPEVVIHAASVTDVDLCEQDPALATRVNATATGFLADACRKEGCFLIYVSTDYVFDGRRGQYKEEDEPDPINEYGRSKLLGEKHVSQGGGDFCIARASVVFGWAREHRPNFATWLHRELSTQQATKVVTDQFASPTLNSQLGRMLLEVAERRLKGIFHLAGSTRISRYQFALRLARKFSFDENLIVPVKSESIDWKAKRPFDSSLNVTKALETLNSKPVPIEEAIEEFVREAPKT